MPKVDGINTARVANKDEFYTALTDVEKEMKYYKKYFKDKVVYCNCDDGHFSNFFRYFAMKFESLGLKKLIATGFNPDGKGILSIYEGDKNGNLKVDEEEITYSELEGNGDFRSQECIDILKEADIVCTNPPFSLFREYLGQLVKYQKKFIILGNVNAVSYKEVFPLFKDNQLWFGVSIHSGDREFQVPNDYPLNASGCRTDDQGRKYIRVKGVRWYTNLETRQRYEELDLYKKYDPETYPTFDFYNAINVDVTAEIPCDYAGVMGVPITFLDKYCPTQFEILNCNDYRKSESVPVKDSGLVKDKDSAINGKPKYVRVLIRKIQ